MSEHQNIEYKSIWKDEFLKWICGFANAQGGTLFIGRDDNGDVKNLKNAKKLLEDLPNKIRKDNYYEEYLKNLGLNDRQIDALIYFKSKGEITTSEYAQKYKVTDRTARIDLNKLSDIQLLIKKGETNQSKYLYV